ncbi:hypothetical protein HDU87_005388 [Geranomyces variabilis]|uniref:Histone-lysine N-methyltransferase NSD-like PHD zinc finger 1 domain-containing protein n=1 Tax=Geranomyces variabilis TaxID=109894 RepID=A0AAD5TIS0_9FUNG|nr:hypothetical protein HDU87_005388 [Geranomyces variabilis]
MQDMKGTMILCKRDVSQLMMDKLLPCTSLMTICQGCNVGWYHLACVGLSNPPKGEWICSQCCFEPI